MFKSVLCLLNILGLCQQVSVNIEPSGILLLEVNQSEDLVCVTSANDTIVTFTLDDEVVQNSTDNTLTISYVNETSVTLGGVYACSVDDDESGMTFYSQDITFVVFAPLITMDPVDVLATDIESVAEFNCTAVGSPAPNITWYRLREGADLMDFDSATESVTRSFPLNCHF